MLLLVTTVLLIVISILSYIYARKCFKFWKNRGIPSTSPSSICGDIGNVIFGRKHMTFALDDIYKSFVDDPYVGFFEFTRPNLMIKDPDIIESILVKDFSCFTDHFWLPPDKHNRLFKHLFIMKGKEWKDLRTKMITTFTTNKMRSMISSMEGCAKILDTLISEKTNGEDADIKELISRFATDVIGCCVFGLHFNTLKDPDSEFRKIGKNIFKLTVRGSIVNFLRLAYPKLISVLKLSEFPPEIERFFVGLLEQSKEFRKNETVRRTDLMQLILDVREQERLNAIENNCEEIIDDDSVLANTFLFFAAGFETTANTLSFCFYELALNPEIQEKLRDEVQTILKSADDVLTYEDLKKMTYTEMIINEVLRKYNPATFLMRVCTAPYQLPNSDYQLLPGERLMIPTYSLHWDEKYFPNPNKFDPERFTPENIASRPAYTYMPFGGGPRICLDRFEMCVIEFLDEFHLSHIKVIKIFTKNPAYFPMGQFQITHPVWFHITAIRFAKMEMKLCLARIISKYKFSPCKKTPIPIKYDPRTGILTSKDQLLLEVKKVSHT